MSSPQASPPSTPWFVYVARCADGTLYTGVARDVAARLAQHAIGRGAKYTRGRAPLRLEGAAACDSHSGALRVERVIKALRRAAKLALASAPGALDALVARLGVSPRGPTPGGLDEVQHASAPRGLIRETLAPEDVSVK